MSGKTGVGVSWTDPNTGKQMTRSLLLTKEELAWFTDLLDADTWPTDNE